jgi:hypothetical protein
MSLLSLRNFTYITLMYNSVESSNFDKYFIFNVDLNIFKIMIKICPLKYFWKYKTNFNGFVCLYVYVYIYIYI